MFTSGRRSQHLIDRRLRGIARGRFERSLSGVTAASALLTTGEIAIEHYRASFGDPWMWTPLAVTPPLVAAGVGGVFSRRVAKTWLPAASALYLAVGLVGQYFHLRGVARRPGGFSLPVYNLAMGPPPLAPGLMTIVGAMGILAAVLRRER